MKKSLTNLLLGAVLTLTMHLPSSATTLPNQEAQILKLVELALDDESGREFVRSFALSSGQRVDDEMLRGLYAKPEREVESLRILLIGEVVTKKFDCPMRWFLRRSNIGHPAFGQQSPTTHIYKNLKLSRSS